MQGSLALLVQTSGLRFLVRKFDRPSRAEAAAVARAQIHTAFWARPFRSQLRLDFQAVIYVAQRQRGSDFRELYNFIQIFIDPFTPSSTIPIMKQSASTVGV